MARKRSYRDQCGIARALDVIGERWSLLVVRELLLGPKRFTDLRTGLPSVSPDVLSDRLRDLERSELIERRRLDPPAGSRVYELTDRGRALEPALLELGRWGSSAPRPAEATPLGIDASIVGLRSMFEPGSAPAGELEIELRLDRRPFTARVADGELELEPGGAADPGAVLETEPGTLAALVWHGRGLEQAERSGEAEVSGDRRALERFLRLFGAPGRP